MLLKNPACVGNVQRDQLTRCLPEVDQTASSAGNELPDPGLRSAAPASGGPGPSWQDGGQHQQGQWRRPRPGQFPRFTPRCLCDAIDSSGGTLVKWASQLTAV
jgi:hypothetical protein